MHTVQAADHSQIRGIEQFKIGAFHCSLPGLERCNHPDAQRHSKPGTGVTMSWRSRRWFGKHTWAAVCIWAGREKLGATRREAFWFQDTGRT